MPPTTDLWMAELGQSKPYTTKVKRVVNRHRTRSFSVVDTSFRRREDSETEPFRTSLKPPAINRVEVFAEISAGLSHQSRETGSVFRRFRSNLRNRRWTIVSSRSWPLPKKNKYRSGTISKVIDETEKNSWHVPYSTSSARNMRLSVNFGASFRKSTTSAHLHRFLIRER